MDKAHKIFYLLVTVQNQDTRHQHTYTHMHTNSHAQANKTAFKHIIARTHKHTYTHNPYVHIYVEHAHTATTINTWHGMMGARGECRVFDTVLWYIFCAMFSLMTDFDMCSFYSLSLPRSLFLLLPLFLLFILSFFLSLSLAPSLLPPSRIHSLCFYLYPIFSIKERKTKKKKTTTTKRKKKKKK